MDKLRLSLIRTEKPENWVGIFSGNSSLGPDRLQPIPIELDPMSLPVRHDRKPVLDPQRLRNVLIQPEPMGFQIRPVRAGRQQVDRHVMSPMAGYRQIEGLRQMGDLHK